MDYNLFHAERANSLRNVSGKRVLVIGCNTGGDCTYFVDFGSAEVHGVDVVAEVGRDFRHERVKYHRVSAETLPFRSRSFDLVYTFATMEHVPDIFSAFSEMARVLAPGGLIYSVAAPLWNSRNGHHFPQYFSSFPWAHLRLDPDAALSFLIDNNIEVDASLHTSREYLIQYMYNSEMFNMRPASDYQKAVSRLKGLRILYHEVESEPEGSVPENIRAELNSKGYSDAELRGVNHVFIAERQTFRARLRDSIYNRAKFIRRFVLGIKQ